MGLQSHEKECAIRYGHINENLENINRNFRQVAFAGSGVMLAVLGFLIKLTFFS
jgi:hypothetical protein